MKQFLTFIFLALFVNFGFSQTQKTIVTGPDYTDEVYFSFEEGPVKTVARDTWDMAFCTDSYDFSILANNGNLVELYTYPDGDVSNWDETLDITNIGAWPKMYNSIESWSGGAFTANYDSENDNDFGWGIFNQVTHKIQGDSIFIMKLANGQHKKIVIVEKTLMSNIWTFKYANLDGTDEQEIIIESGDYSNMNFVHYSIVNQAIVEQEADAADWNLLFTRYLDYTIGDDGYMVSGVLSKFSASNYGTVVQEVQGVDQETFYGYDPEETSDMISEIGGDWKHYNLKAWEVHDDVVFFVQDVSQDNPPVWKLYFTEFGGMGNGEITFIQENISGSGISNPNKAFSTIYPNPANDAVNIIYDIDGKCNIAIYDISGKIVYSEAANHNEKLNKHRLNVENLPAGFYNVIIRAGQVSSSAKFIKQ